MKEITWSDTDWILALADLDTDIRKSLFSGSLCSTVLVKLTNRTRCDLNELFFQLDLRSKLSS